MKIGDTCLIGGLYAGIDFYKKAVGSLGTLTCVKKHGRCDVVVRGLRWSIRFDDLLNPDGSSANFNNQLMSPLLREKEEL